MIGLIKLGLEKNCQNLVLKKKKVKMMDRNGKVITHLSIYIYIYIFGWLIEIMVFVFCKLKPKSKPRFV